MYDTVDKMSDLALVACVLGMSASDESVAAVASLVAQEGWLSGASLTDLVREHGCIGPKRVARLEAAIELGRRALAARARREARTVSTPEDVVRLMGPVIGGQDREHFWALCLNTKNQLLRMVEVSVGSLAASVVHPRELLRQAIAVSAASVVVCHCHPSGDPTPSGADIQLTRRLVRAGDVVGIDVLDHVIVGGEAHASLRELGLM